MKYKVGDKVRVRKDLIIDNVYGKHIFVVGMKPYVGKTMTISRVNKHSYYFIEDKNNWCWSDEMLEDVASISIFIKGNKVIAKKDGKVGIAKCSPEDEFDIFIGVKLAIDRLEKECKPYIWLKEGMSYYRPDINIDTMYTYSTYYNDDTDKRLMSRGLVFKTKEEAIEAAKKMLAALKEG